MLDKVRPARTAGDRLRKAVLELAAGHAALLEHRERGWASITFSGGRHTLMLRFEGAEAVKAGEHFIDRLPDHEFTLPGHLVAQATIMAVDHRLNPPLMIVTCEMLLLEEG